MSYFIIINNNVRKHLLIETRHMAAAIIIVLEK